MGNGPLPYMNQELSVKSSTSDKLMVRSVPQIAKTQVTEDRDVSPCHLIVLSVVSPSRQDNTKEEVIININIYRIYRDCYTYIQQTEIMHSIPSTVR